MKWSMEDDSQAIWHNDDLYEMRDFYDKNEHIFIFFFNFCHGNCLETIRLYSFEQKKIIELYLKMLTTLTTCKLAYKTWYENAAMWKIIYFIWNQSCYHNNRFLLKSIQSKQIFLHKNMTFEYVTRWKRVDQFKCRFMCLHLTC